MRSHLPSVNIIIAYIPRFTWLAKRRVADTLSQVQTATSHIICRQSNNHWCDTYVLNCFNHCTVLWSTGRIKVCMLYMQYSIPTGCHVLCYECWSFRTLWSHVWANNWVRAMSVYSAIYRRRLCLRRWLPRTENIWFAITRYPSAFIITSRPLGTGYLSNT